MSIRDLFPWIGDAEPPANEHIEEAHRVVAGTWPPPLPDDPIAADFAYLRRYAFETLGHWDEGNDAKVGKRLAAISGSLRGYDAKLDEIHDRRRA